MAKGFEPGNVEPASTIYHGQTLAGSEGRITAAGPNLPSRAQLKKEQTKFLGSGQVRVPQYAHMASPCTR